MTQYMTIIMGRKTEDKNEINEKIKTLNDNGERIVSVLDYKEDYLGDYYFIKLTVLVEKEGK